MHIEHLLCQSKKLIANNTYEQYFEGEVQVHICNFVLNVAFSLIFFRTGFVWEQYNDRTGEGQVNLNQFVNFGIQHHAAKFSSTPEAHTRLLLSGLQTVHWLVCPDSANDGRDLLMRAQQGTSDRNDILHVLCYLFGGLTYKCVGGCRTINANVVTLVNS